MIRRTVTERQIARLEKIANNAQKFSLHDPDKQLQILLTIGQYFTLTNKDDCAVRYSLKIARLYLQDAKSGNFCLDVREGKKWFAAAIANEPTMEGKFFLTKLFISYKGQVRPPVMSRLSNFWSKSTKPSCEEKTSLLPNNRPGISISNV